MACHDAPVAGPVIIRISPMAHFIAIFMALALLVFVPLAGNWVLAALVVPVALSVAIERLRTVADRESVTARTLLATRRLAWDQVDGLRFHRGGWARARRTDGTETVLPAVTFATLPRLAAASGGQVPNPYLRGESGERIGAVQDEPGGDTAGDAEQQGDE